VHDSELTFEASVPRLTSKPDRDDDPVSSVVNSWGSTHILEGLHLRGRELHDPGMAARLVRLRQTPGGHEHTIRAPELLDCREVNLAGLIGDVERRIASPCQLNVVTRHRPPSIPDLRRAEAALQALSLARKAAAGQRRAATRYCSTIRASLGETNRAADPKLRRFVSEPGNRVVGIVPLHECCHAETARAFSPAGACSGLAGSRVRCDPIARFMLDACGDSVVALTLGQRAGLLWGVGQALDIVRRQYEAFARQDWGALFALYDAAVEADLSRSGIPDLGVSCGHDGLREGWGRWRGAWERYDLELEDLIESSDRVLALSRVRARSRGHGLDAEFRGADLFTVRDGLIVRFVNYLDREQARRDAGF
jgi:ketosteroid isomerase-like protein